MIPKLDYVCKTVKVIPEETKQTRNYLELVCKIIKVTRVVIVSMYVTLTEI